MPIKAYWTWVLTFLDVAGAFGLELILLGEMIRVAAKERQKLELSKVVRKISLVLYAGIAIWYFKACADVGGVFSEENLDKLLLALGSVLISVVAGLILGAIISHSVLAIFPVEKSKESRSTE